jgi:hypothetical protein
MSGAWIDRRPVILTGFFAVLASIALIVVGIGMHQRLGLRFWGPITMLAGLTLMAVYTIVGLVLMAQKRWRELTGRGEIQTEAPPGKRDS